ncbi:MAG: penicillin-binding transpeptidase domain-containing protein, partial [Eubacteriales bacterium]
MKLAFLKTYLLLFLLVIMAFSFCACETSNPAKTAEDFLDAIAKQDFARAYSYSWPYSSNSLDEEAFVKKYEAIFDGLGIVEMEITDSFVTTDSFGTLYTYTASYITEEYGTFTYDFSMELRSVESVTYVVWEQNLIFPFMDFEDELHVETVPAIRGEIFTEDGDILAKNEFATAIYMDVTQIKNIMSLSESLAEIINVSKDDIIEVFTNTLALNERLGRNNVGVIASYPNDYFTDEEKETLLSFDGIGIDTELYAPIRYYPYGEYMAHIIGYMGAITPEYMDTHPDRGYDLDSRVGKTGLEASYEVELRGKDGLIIYTSDKWGNQKEVLYEEYAIQGQDLILSIVISKQIEAYNLLKENTYSGQNGVAIVMDAKTGAVQAMASYPSYDNNLFSFPIDSETWKELNDPDNDQPLYDRATQGLYPPGSLLKPFTIIPALESGKVTINSAFDGTIVNNQWMPHRSDWNSPPITRVSNTGSPLTLTNALIKSDNIYFAWVALKVGAEGMTEFLSSIGFAQPFDFDIPVRTSNIINEGDELYARLLADMGYGQGELLISPLQMASLYSAYANGTGDSMKPYLVSQIKQTQGTKHVLIQSTEPTVAIANLMEAKTYNTVYPLLRRVVTEGTGRRVSSVVPPVAGKTG